MDQAIATATALASEMSQAELGALQPAGCQSHIQLKFVTKIKPKSSHNVSETVGNCVQQTVKHQSLL